MRIYVCFIVTLFFTSISFGQIPIYYYDFEGGNTFGTNTNRNTNPQTNAEAKVSTGAGVANVTALDNGITTSLVNNSGNGLIYLMCH